MDGSISIIEVKNARSAAGLVGRRLFGADRFWGVLPFRKNAGKMQGRLKNAVNSNILEVVFFSHFLSQNELVW